MSKQFKLINNIIIDKKNNAAVKNGEIKLETLYINCLPIYPTNGGSPIMQQIAIKNPAHVTGAIRNVPPIFQSSPDDVVLLKKQQIIDNAAENGRNTIHSAAIPSNALNPYNAIASAL